MKQAEIDRAILAVLSERTESYGAEIHRIIEQQGAHNLSFGTLYAALDRLTKKGVVSARWGESTPERGGRRKRYYRIVEATNNG